ncbi:class I SAM-dependent methyltransferase [Rhodocytophaga rosea]|uniref:Class I SAM-dependent methyltransferase n=1 Tax=Rhodocytophaga rosea TaxID=2704465 RepID=A0A6C0GRR5_9BACT|nr:class I SAM-dependent methyltransferase [Rhodocytophaga rosea]QHT70554.1 class I SAM-dependent methyltransferase [Rhodocytophaga rosea]
MVTRIDNEILHGKKIAGQAEDVWNWNSPAGRLRAQRRAQYFIDIGKIHKTDKVLEIGCGTGLFTGKVYEATKASITAIDISEDLLKIARSRYPHVNFRVEDAMKLSFADKSYDVVFGSSVIHHLNIESALKETFRVLKKGGRIIFAEPNMLNPQIFIQKNIPFIKKWLGDSPDETAIVRWKMYKQLADIGYNHIKVFPYDFLHPITPNILINSVQSIGKVIEHIPVLKEIAGSVIIYAEK